MPSRGSLFCLGTSPSWRLRRVNMLGPKSHPNHSRRNPAQHRPPSHQLQKSWKRRPLMTREQAADESILDENLQPLSHAGGKLAAGLDFAQRIDADWLSAQARGENIGGRDRVLNREVDSHPSDRRHRMRRIADAEQPGTKPRRKRSTATDSRLIWSQSVDLVYAITKIRREGREVRGGTLRVPCSLDLRRSLPCE